MFGAQTGDPLVIKYLLKRPEVNINTIAEGILIMSNYKKC